MTTYSALLRNIHPSGGLFTENILLRLRDNPERLKIGQIDSFVNDKEGKSRNWILNHRKKVFEWGQQKWDEIEPIIEKLSSEELKQKWLIPFFEQMGYDLEPFDMDDEDFDEDSVLNDFRISYQSKWHKNPYFHFVDIVDGFDSKVQKNPKKLSHHIICQKFVNSKPKINWLILSNGRNIRLITKYFYSYSQGYLEFDLENIFAKRDIKEFNTLFALIFPNRFQSLEDKTPSIIDEFQQESIKEGVKIGDSLRDNVHDALVLLGNELIQQNSNLSDKFRNNEIDLQEFYAELLRIIYRIIFILYAEQRNMLPGTDSIYFKNFSLSSFKFLAERPIKSDSNYDLWKKLFITFSLLRSGNDYLQVPCFNGNLFDNSKIPIIFNESGLSRITNDITLRIIRLLTTSKINNLRQRINFLEVSEEEIGAIYESLLDYFPKISQDMRFNLNFQKTDRKGTGSYYTPKSLIEILIKTNLEPIIKKKLSEAGASLSDKRKALLSIKICDPACGGGTFLLSALDYMGTVLFSLNTEKKPDFSIRHARREILKNCIYGVDKNPLAVELAKISLWLRACVNDKPLNFLDNHIKCGNSLIGLGKKPKNIQIFPEFFEAIKGNVPTGIIGENKQSQNKIREQIRNEIKIRARAKKKITYITSFLSEDSTIIVDSDAFQEILLMSEDSLEDLERKKESYMQLRKKQKFIKATDEANTWASSFFWPIEEDVVFFPNNTFLGEIRADVSNKRITKMLKKINNIASKQTIFHWYLEFPEIFNSEKNGFDCILMNPPWNVYSLIEEEFFLKHDLEIAKSRSKERVILIKRLKDNNPKLYDLYINKKIEFEKEKNYFQNSKNFGLSAIGKLDLYPLFTELAYNLINDNGSLGIVCPIGIIYSYVKLFEQFLSQNQINECAGFINTKKIFPTVANHKQFCLLSIMKNNKDLPRFLFNIQNISEYYDENNFFQIESEDFILINPNTRTPPFPKNQQEFDLLKKIYLNSETILKDLKSKKNKMDIHRMFNISDDRRKGVLLTKEELMEKNFELKNNMQMVNNSILYYPVYEGKFIFQYDFLYGTFEGTSQEERNKRRAHCLPNSNKNLPLCEPRYWCKKEDFIAKLNHWHYEKKWFLSYRDSTGPKNLRTIIFSIIPWIPTVYTLYNFINISAKEAIILISQFNSFVMDFVFRKKMATNHLTQVDIQQLPFIPKKRIEKYYDIIYPILIKLIYTNTGLEDFAKETGYDGDIFKWDEEERFELMCELNGLYFLLFNLNKDDIHYVLDDFETLKKNEIKKFKHFKSKARILAYFEEFKKKFS